MLLQIDHHSGVPAYRQLMDQIRFQISSGRLRPGDELPSPRVLSSQIDVTPIAIGKAYRLLREDGILDPSDSGPPRVARPDPKKAATRRRDQLRVALSPALEAARRLGATRDETLDLFREMFDEKP